MKNNTIENTIAKNLCCSCGICAGLCVKQSICMHITEGCLLPQINHDTCINCGLCYSVCPGKDILSLSSINNEILTGQVLNVYSGNVQDEHFLLKTASGGICTKLITELLQKKLYDSAFLVDTFDYSQYVKTKRFESIIDINKIGRSRYIPVSHEEAVKYILSHRQERIIIVGTSCAIKGFCNLIEKYHLSKDNYLLIGLFCDKMMNYHVWDYFADKACEKTGRLKSLYFRTKEINGWPGDMKLEYEKSKSYLPKKERLAVKDFFCNRRCLYCTDKLNVYADISLGDNYTGQNTIRLGSSNIIIRTLIGKSAFNVIKNLLTLNEVEINMIFNSQEVYKKNENYYFQSLHSGKKAPIKLHLKYTYKLFKIKVGDLYGKYPWLMKIMCQIESLIKKY